MLKLRIEDDEGQEKIVPIIRDEITIGRQEGNTIRLTERNVSRKHARLIREGDELWVEDISARYGTLKNGEKILERVSFGAADMIRIGDYSLTLQSDAPAQAAAPDSDFNAEPTAIKPLSASEPPPKRRGHEGTEILPAMPAKLVIISSNFAGQEFPLSRKQMIIGRGEDCDIIIDHRSVSQRHAKILREHNTRYQIVDLNSKNGVRISGEKYTSTYIKRGDIVELGHVKFRFVEAGENYVFTPQSIEDDEATQFAASPATTKSKGPLILAGIVLLLVAVLGIAFVMSGKDKDPEPEDTKPVAATDVKEPIKKDSVLADNDPPSTNPKIAKGIALARQHIEAGEVEKAIGKLEGLLDYANPSAQDKEKISELLTTARNERPFQDAYRSVQADIKGEQYVSALRNLGKLPGHTLFAKLSKEKSFKETALNGAVGQAKDSIDSGDKDAARVQLEQVLELEPEHGPAASLLASMNQPVAKNNSPTQSDPPKKTTPKKPKPAAPKITSAEAAELGKAAGKKVFAGDPAGAIGDCKKALKGGHRDCHRIMGLAYKLQGNTSRACSSFNKALKGKPKNAKGIMSQMEKLGCDM